MTKVFFLRPSLLSVQHVDLHQDPLRNPQPIHCKKLGTHLIRHSTSEEKERTSLIIYRSDTSVWGTKLFGPYGERNRTKRTRTSNEERGGGCWSVAWAIASHHTLILHIRLLVFRPACLPACCTGSVRCGR